MESRFNKKDFKISLIKIQKSKVFCMFWCVNCLGFMFHHSAARTTSTLTLVTLLSPFSSPLTSSRALTAANSHLCLCACLCCSPLRCVESSLCSRPTHTQVCYSAATFRRHYLPTFFSPGNVAVCLMMWKTFFPPLCIALSYNFTVVWKDTNKQTEKLYFIFFSRARSCNRSGHLYIYNVI